MDRLHKKKKYITIAIICLMIAAFVCIIIVTGRKKAETMEYSKTGFAMGTVINITTYGGGENCIQDIEQLIGRLETDEISWRTRDSEIWRINHEYEPGKAYEISYELAEYIAMVKELYVKGDGLLDATIRPLASLWGIEDGNSYVPDEQDIKSALKNVNMDLVDINLNEGGHSAITLQEANMSIDLGSVGKGIGCDKVYEYLTQSDITGACIAIGGSIVIYGSKPDKSSYKLGIRNPRGETGDVMGVLTLATEGKGIFMSTSGDYEKYFEENGQRYHHILNPKTGYPADTGIISATIVCDNGLISDGLSTLAVLLGKDKAFSLIESYNAEAVLIDSDGNVYVTKGLKDAFALQCDDYKVVE
ncbi:MAG: FAD:protein FMN transferase [Coprococcus sp.]